MKRGFVPLIVIAVVTLVSALTAGGAYTAYKVNQLQKENESIKTELESQKIKAEVLEVVPIQTEPEPSDTLPQADKNEETEKYIVESDTTSGNDNSSAYSLLEHSNSAVPPNPTVIGEVELKILNVKAETMGDSTDITWETNVLSDSRIIMDDDFFVSNSNNSKNHSVSFSDLPLGVVYNYQIIATSNSSETSYFGKFSTPSEYKARFAYSKDEDCFVVIIEDGNGGALSNVSLKISGAIYNSQSGGRYVPKAVFGVTSVWGEVEYCNNIDEIKVENTETGKVYYDGDLPLVW